MSSLNDDGIAWRLQGYRVWVASEIHRNTPGNSTQSVRSASAEPNWRQVQRVNRSCVKMSNLLLDRAGPGSFVILIWLLYALGTAFSYALAVPDYGTEASGDWPLALTAVNFKQDALIDAHPFSVRTDSIQPPELLRAGGADEVSSCTISSLQDPLSAPIWSVRRSDNSHPGAMDDIVDNPSLRSSSAGFGLQPVRAGPRTHVSMTFGESSPETGSPWSDKSDSAWHVGDSGLAPNILERTGSPVASTGPERLEQADDSIGRKIYPSGGLRTSTKTIEALGSDHVLLQLRANTCGGELRGDQITACFEDDGSLEFTFVVEDDNTAQGARNWTFTLVSSATTVPATMGHYDGSTWSPSDADYATTGSFSISIPVNAEEASREVTIEIRDDDLEESHETISFLASNNYNNVTKLYVIYIIDNERPVLGFVYGTYRVPEYLQKVPFNVMQWGPVSNPVTADLKTESVPDYNHPATPGVDYLSVDKPLVFSSPGPNIRPDSVILIHDREQETHDERFDLYLIPRGDRVTLHPLQSKAEVYIKDSPVASIGIVVPGNLMVREGGEKTYTVKLASPPDKEVTVTITDDGDTDLTNRPDMLTFTRINWSKEQKFTVSAGHDDDVVDDSEVLTHLASGGIYEGRKAAINVTISDDDRGKQALIIDPKAVTVTEGSDVGSMYTVKLATEPSAPVGVAIAWDRSSDIEVDPEDLTFTMANWDDEQSVKVTARKDDDAVQDPAVTLQHTAKGGDYSDKTGQVRVTVTEADEAGLVISKNEQPIDDLSIEEGMTSQYAVRLQSQPSSEVTVEITSDNPNVMVTDGTALKFNDKNWSVDQMVGVKAEHDPDAAEDNAVLTHAASGDDYGGVVKTLRVSVTDDDDGDQALVIDPLILSIAENGSGKYHVSLATQPSDVVTIDIVSDNLDVDLINRSLTFQIAKWNEKQAVELKVKDDADADNEKATLTHTASGGDYSSLMPSVVEVMVADDDKRALIFSSSTVEVSEGSQFTYDVKLATLPSGPVTVTILGHEGTVVAPIPTILKFTTDDWNAAQSVTVSAGRDTDTESETVLLEHSASGGGYDAVKGTVTVEVTDLSIPSLFVSTRSVTVQEDGIAQRYAIRLTTLPTGLVKVSITGNQGTDLQVEPDRLEFSTTNWNVLQDVEIRAVDDPDAMDDNITLTHTASGGGYGSVASVDIEVTVEDDDEPDLVVNPTAVTLIEGSSAKEIEVSLATLPSESVTVSVELSEGLADNVSINPKRIVFTPLNWPNSQSITAEASKDQDRDNHSGMVHLYALGGEYDGESAEVAVTVIDSYRPPRIRILSDMTVREDEGRVEFRVGLDRAADQTVTVKYYTRAVTADAGVDYVETSDKLTFQEGEQEKQVWVPILDDLVDEDDEVFVLELHGEDGAVLDNSIGHATILDNDDAPTASIAPAAYVREGGVAKVHVSLSNPSSKTVTVMYSTSDRTAEGEQDYAAATSMPVTIASGETGVVVEVVTNDDQVNEGRETFLVELDGGSRSIVTILDNDVMPGLSVEDVVVSEDGGRARLAVTLSGASAVRVGVAYVTYDGTATVGEDYMRSIGTLVFAPGETVRNVWVPVQQDEVVEEDETFTLRLSAPEHAKLLDEEGVITITDDPLQVSIYDGTGAENAGELILPVRLNFASSSVVTVQFSVTGGTATSDVDYEATQGVVVFEPGSVEAQVRIPLKDDDIVEGDETVEVTLSDPRNAVLGLATATGTITDDDSLTRSARCEHSPYQNWRQYL